jgi:5-carboxymethyl-2-hydroxymuconate isomerase
MTSDQEPTRFRKERLKRERYRVAKGMADLAYFQARLSLIDGQSTTGARAAAKAFKVLHKVQSHQILRQRRDAKQGPGDGD